MSEIPTSPIESPNPIRGLNREATRTPETGEVTSRVNEVRAKLVKARDFLHDAKLGGYIMGGFYGAASVGIPLGMALAEHRAPGFSQVVSAFKESFTDVHDWPTGIRAVSEGISNYGAIGGAAMGVVTGRQERNVEQQIKGVDIVAGTEKVGEYGQND